MTESGSAPEQSSGQGSPAVPSMLQPAQSLPGFFFLNETVQVLSCC